MRRTAKLPNIALEQTAARMRSPRLLTASVRQMREKSVRRRASEPEVSSYSGSTTLMALSYWKIRLSG